MLENQTHLTFRNIEEITRDLTYLNPRATKACSLPVPLVHAHLAANRSRRYDTAQTAQLHEALRNHDGNWWV